MNGYALTWFLCYTATVILTTIHWGQNSWVDALLLILCSIHIACFIGMLMAFKDENGLIQAQKELESLKKDLHQVQLVNRVLKAKVNKWKR